MALTNRFNLPQPLVDAVTREYRYKDKQYSVTSLLKGTCQTLLERRHFEEIDQDVSDMIWLIFGSAVHKIVEEGKETDDQLKENKIIIDVADGYKLSGIFDLYDSKEKKVTDYKTASVWKVQFNDWEDYRKQLLCYAYMLRSIGFECDKGEIVALLKDHSKTKAKIENNYPEKPVHIEQFEFSDEDIEQIKSFIENKFKELKRCESLSDDELPECSDEERWHKPDTWAVKKRGGKIALRRFEDKEQAKAFAEKKGLDKHWIEYRKGKDSKCEEYCSVKDFCPYYRKRMEDEALRND